MLKTSLAAAAVSVLLAACSDPVAAPEPANEDVASEMPQTPDMATGVMPAEGAADAAATPPAAEPADTPPAG